MQDQVDLSAFKFILHLSVEDCTVHFHTGIFRYPSEEDVTFNVEAPLPSFQNTVQI